MMPNGKLWPEPSLLFHSYCSEQCCVHDWEIDIRIWFFKTYAMKLVEKNLFMNHTFIVAMIFWSDLWPRIYFRNSFQVNSPTAAKLIHIISCYPFSTSWWKKFDHRTVNNFHKIFFLRLPLPGQFCGRLPHIRQLDIKRLYKRCHILHSLSKPSWVWRNVEGHMPWTRHCVCSFHICLDSLTSKNFDDLWVRGLHWRWVPLFHFTESKY